MNSQPGCTNAFNSHLGKTPEEARGQRYPRFKGLCTESGHAPSGALGNLLKAEGKINYSQTNCQKLTTLKFLLPGLHQAKPRPLQLKHGRKAQATVLAQTEVSSCTECRGSSQGHGCHSRPYSDRSPGSCRSVGRRCLERRSGAELSLNKQKTLCNQTVKLPAGRSHESYEFTLGQGRLNKPKEESHQGLNRTQKPH